MGAFGLKQNTTAVASSPPTARMTGGGCVERD